MADGEVDRDAGTRAAGPSSGHDDPTVVSPDRLEGPGTVIGRYKLLEQIGEGGFGVVYLAEQTAPVKRRVALKIIKLGMDTKQVIGRFEAERQALALMEHPNIAKVLDAGATDTGRSFFVMELVKGVPITEYCDQHKVDAQRRLGLFVDVCRAVQHAHQKGIIHRDLKPSNVLVTLHDGVPVPKVIDFGIAKATNQELTEKTVFTEYRQFIGTPAYMSPEQAEFSGLDIDTRSDIYSLGVMLYEILTGVTPFDEERLRSAALGEIQRIIREEDPKLPSTRIGAMLSGASRVTKESSQSSVEEIARHRHTDPRTLSRSLRGDLDWIVMRCLEKDRTRRYETANGLAADIERHLRDEPVAASPPGAGYRIKKFVRRNRTVVTAGAAIAVVLLAATIVSATAGVIAIRARGELAEQLAATETARRESEAVTEFLSSMLASANPREKGKDARVLDLVDEAAASIKGDFADQPLVEARLRRTLSQTYQSLGEFDEAERHALASLETRRQILGEDDPQTLASAHTLNSVALDFGRFAESRESVERTLERCRRVLGDDDPLTLSAQSMLGKLHHAMAEYEEAETLHAKTLEQRRRVLGEDDPATLFSMHWLAGAINRQGRRDEAEALLVELLDRRRAALGEDHLDTLWSMQQLAIMKSSKRRHAEAQALHERVLEGRRKVHGDDHPGTLWSMHYLGLCYRDQGRLDQAAEMTDACREGRRRVLGPENPDFLWSSYELARLRAMQRRFDEAEELFEEVVEGQRRIFGPDHRITLASLSFLGRVYGDQDRHDDAAETFGRVVRGRRRAIGDEHPLTLTSMHQHGFALSNLEQYDEAAGVLEEAVVGRRKVLGEDDPITFWSEQLLARAYGAIGREADARALYESVLDGRRRVLGEQHPDTRTAKNNLAYSLLDSETPEQSDTSAAVALAREACDGAKRPVPLHLGTLARALFETGATEEAAATLREALEHLPDGAPDRAEFEETLRRYEAAYEAAAGPGP